MSDQSEIEDEDEQSGLIPSSRRSVLAGMTGVALLGSASQSAAAASGDHLGESWTGSPSNYGLEVSVDSKDGLRGITSDPSGRGLYGEAASGSGYTKGVRGQADSPKGTGVFGTNLNSSGPGFGVRGRTNSTEGQAVFGNARSGSGSTIGVKGNAQSPDGIGVRGINKASQGFAKGVFGESKSSGGIGVHAFASASNGTTYGVYAAATSSDGYGLYTPDDAKIDGDLELGGSVNNTMTINSDLQVSGTKNFVQTVDTTAGPKDIHYTSVEAGKARTEHTGVAEIDGGHALIELPAHFDMVTSDDEPIAVQVTAHAEEKVHPQVVEKSTRYVSIEDFGDGPDDYSFSYTVKGVRDGFEDEQVVRDA